MRGGQSGVRDHHLTGTSSGALAVKMSQHVCRTADTAVIFTHTPPKPDQPQQHQYQCASLSRDIALTSQSLPTFRQRLKTWLFSKIIPGHFRVTKQFTAILAFSPF